LEVFGGDSEFRELLLVCDLFPLEQSLGKAPFVEIDQSQLHALHVVVVEATVFFPNLDSSVKDILMPFNSVSEKLRLVFLGGKFD